MDTLRKSHKYKLTTIKEETTTNKPRYYKTFDVDDENDNNKPSQHDKAKPTCPSPFGAVAVISSYLHHIISSSTCREVDIVQRFL